MAKYELKTKQSKASVSAFINSLENPQQKADAKIILKLMQEITKEKPKMWGASIIGFGSYHYISKSGIEADWMLTGFSPRKSNLSIYIMPGFKNYGDLLNKLGLYKHSVGCLYIKKLEDIHLPTLKKLIMQSVRDMKIKYK